MRRKRNGRCYEPFLRFPVFCYKTLCPYNTLTRDNEGRRYFPIISPLSLPLPRFALSGFPLSLPLFLFPSRIRPSSSSADLPSHWNFNIIVGDTMETVSIGALVERNAEEIEARALEVLERSVAALANEMKALRRATARFGASLSTAVSQTEQIWSGHLVCQCGDRPLEHFERSCFDLLFISLNESTN